MVVDNRFILLGKFFLHATCPGTSLAKNICRTLVDNSASHSLCILIGQLQRAAIRKLLKRCQKVVKNQSKNFVRWSWLDAHYFKSSNPTLSLSVLSFFFSLEFDQVYPIKPFFLFFFTLNILICTVGLVVSSLDF